MSAVMGGIVSWGCKDKKLGKLLWSTGFPSNNIKDSKEDLAEAYYQKNNGNLTFILFLLSVVGGGRHVVYTYCGTI